MLHCVANLPLRKPPNKQNLPRSLGVNSQLLYIVLNPSCIYLEHFCSFMSNSLIFNSMFVDSCHLLPQLAEALRPYVRTHVFVQCLIGSNRKFKQENKTWLLFGWFGQRMEQIIFLKKIKIDKACMKYLAPKLYVILSLTIISPKTFINNFNINNVP